MTVISLRNVTKPYIFLTFPLQLHFVTFCYISELVPSDMPPWDENYRIYANPGHGNKNWVPRAGAHQIWSSTDRYSLPGPEQKNNLDMDTLTTGLDRLSSKCETRTTAGASSIAPITEMWILLFPSFRLQNRFKKWSQKQNAKEMWSAKHDEYFTFCRSLSTVWGPPRL